MAPLVDVEILALSALGSRERDDNSECVRMRGPGSGKRKQSRLLQISEYLFPDLEELEEDDRAVINLSLLPEQYQVSHEKLSSWSWSVSESARFLLRTTQRGAERIVRAFHRGPRGRPTTGGKLCYMRYRQPDQIQRPKKSRKKPETEESELEESRLHVVVVERLSYEPAEEHCIADQRDRTTCLLQIPPRSSRPPSSFLQAQRRQANLRSLRCLQDDLLSASASRTEQPPKDSGVTFYIEAENGQNELLLGLPAQARATDREASHPPTMIPERTVTELEVGVEEDDDAGLGRAARPDGAVVPPTMRLLLVRIFRPANSKR
ncbi:hypothetical protein BDZ89DRAFT_1034458 [Hymenopellis radicata]|nr:hypothetical protein BDZ89DRAFT_1034458 [Hymenopellis radicata]